MTKLFTVGGNKVSEDDSLNPFTNVQVENTNSDVPNEVSVQNNNFVSGDIEQPNFDNVQTTIVDNEKKEEYTWVDNTGKTGEDIKNPVYNSKMDESDRKVSGNFFLCFLVFIQALILPGSSIIRNTEKYVEGKKSIKVGINIIIYLVIFSCVGRVISSCFVEKYVAVKKDYAYVLDFGNVSNINYFKIILCAVVFTIGLIIVLATVNYISSFIRNKSLSFGAYLLINALASIPFILGFNVILPVVSVLSKNIAILLFIISFMYSLIIYLNTIDYFMEFSTYNRKVFYILINYSIVLFVILFIVYFFFEGELDTFIKLIM